MHGDGVQQIMLGSPPMHARHGVCAGISPLSDPCMPIPVLC